MVEFSAVRGAESGVDAGTCEDYRVCGDGSVTAYMFHVLVLHDAYMAYLRDVRVGSPVTLGEFARGGVVAGPGHTVSVSSGGNASRLLADASVVDAGACHGLARDGSGVDGAGVSSGVGGAAGGGVLADDGGVGVCDVGSGSGVGAVGGTGSDVGLEVDPLVGLTGRARRKKKRALKAAKAAFVAGPGVESQSGAALEGASESRSVIASESEVGTGSVETVGKSSGVPEWRVKSPRAPMHKGYFSGCSEEKQRELRETRAAMLVAKNKAEAVKAEAEARRVTAQMKSQEIERGVELRRLETEAKLKTAVESKFGVGYSSGFAKTIIDEGLSDIIPVPSLDGSGSVSPDSSVSVAMVRRLEKALENVSEKLAEAEKKNKLLSQVAGTGGAEEVQGTVPKGFRGIITVSPAEEAAMFDRMHAAEQQSFHDGLTGYAELQLAGVVPNEPLGAWGPRGA